MTLSTNVIALLQIVRNDQIFAQFVLLDEAQRQRVLEYAERFEAAMGHPPAGIHWVPALREMVQIMPEKSLGVPPLDPDAELSI